MTQARARSTTDKWPRSRGAAAEGSALAAVVAAAVTALVGACAQAPPAAPNQAGTAAASPTAGTASVAAAATAPAAAPATAAPASPPPTLAFDDAVLAAATSVLGSPGRSDATMARRPIVIDPLIDGITGMQTVATRSMGERLAALVRERYPQYEVQPFNAAAVARNPLALIGTFTGVNAQRQSTGLRDAYRICFALADLGTGKLVGKGLAFARPEGVNPTPLPAFRDSPSWTDDPATTAYVRTCQGTRAGDPINPVYAERILAAALIADAIDAYDAGRYQQALDLYGSAQRLPAGDQFRVYNGLYLANWRLGRRDQADAALRQVIDYGIARKRLAMKFLFRPGSTAFDGDAKQAAVYGLWIKAIAGRATTAQACVEVAGHTSPTGPEPLNERLSLLRAEYVKSRLQGAMPVLGTRLIASGAGSRETMVGTGRDDASDALDRRVEFKVIGC